MTAQAKKPIHIKDVTEYWLYREPATDATGDSYYKPSILIECTINFRSLRAGLNHSEERNYVTWLPTGDLAIDWDKLALPYDETLKLQLSPDPTFGYCQQDYPITANELEQYEANLINNLIRKERLKIYFNPVFGLFSAPGDELPEFLSRVAEAALTRVEPELKRLRNKSELQFEQIREKHATQGVSSDELHELNDAIITRNRRLFESENRLAGLFSTLAGNVFRSDKPKVLTAPLSLVDEELREDLARVEQEAGESLRKLYNEYLLLANEYDIFEIGLQPDNIQVIRRILLWIPEVVSSP